MPLASFYDIHMALEGGDALVWAGSGVPRLIARDVLQVGVGKDAWYTLARDGGLRRWLVIDSEPMVVMQGLRAFAAGDSGCFGIDAFDGLWHAASGAAEPVRIAAGVSTAIVGDGANYYITHDGRLWVRGLAHRGQYGDGLLAETANFVATAQDALDVRAHTGHAIYLRRDGLVLGTGGNRFGPLGTHGLGDKADRWGPVFDGAIAIATGSRHSAAIRADGSLWAWGSHFGSAPRKLHAATTAVAAGDTATIARAADGVLWQWDDGGAPRRLGRLSE